MAQHPPSPRSRAIPPDGAAGGRPQPTVDPAGPAYSLATAALMVAATPSSLPGSCCRILPLLPALDRAFAVGGGLSCSA